MARAAGLLNTELGTMLLAHSYADYESPRAAGLALDPEFIRKHDFFPAGESSPSRWSAAELVQDKQRGNLITGSLSGVAFQLHQIEAGASAQSFGRKDWNKLVPALLSGIRMVPQSLRSERAQEFVALSVRLGRELVAAGAADPSFKAWCNQYLPLLLSALRRERFEDLLRGGDVTGAVDLFSPSELFSLGEAYLISQGILPAGACGGVASFLRYSGNGCGHSPERRAPELVSPVLERLGKVIPPDGSSQYRNFQREVEQYGFPLWRRFDLTDLSFQFCDTYEQLQTYAAPELLFERISDLKIRLAEIGHATGLPASIGGLVGELAIQNLVTDPASATVETWDEVMKQIGRLGPYQVRGWVEELLNQGDLSNQPGKTGEKVEKF